MAGLSEAFDLIGTAIEHHLPATHAAGAALAITDRDAVLGVVVRGFADVAAGTPVRPETRFEIGSISKSFSAAIVMQEVEAGRLDLHVSINEILPWLELPEPFGPITLHHLMTHSSGLLIGTEDSPTVWGGDSRYACQGSYGTVTAYDPNGVIVEQGAFLPQNPCGADMVMLGTVYTVSHSGPVSKLVLAPMSPWEFNVAQPPCDASYYPSGCIEHARATFAVAGYGLARLPWQVMAASFAFNALETAGTVVWATTKHRLVPGNLLGRVSSFDWFISTGLVPVSFAVAGPVAAAVGARATLVGAGIIGGVVTLAALALPGMRDLERRGVLSEMDREPRPAATGQSAPAPS